MEKEARKQMREAKKRVSVITAIKNRAKMKRIIFARRFILT